jgi:hypothetical protein
VKKLEFPNNILFLKYSNNCILEVYIENLDRKMNISLNKNYKSKNFRMDYVWWKTKYRS